MMSPVRFVRRSSRLLPSASFSMFIALFIMVAALTARAQAPHIISFDAPGADTTPGDFNGTYPTGINAGGEITGGYQDTKSVYHGFLRSSNGTFTTFDAPGAGTGPFQGTYPNSINDLGAIAGQTFDSNGVVHGFLRSKKGEFTIFDVTGVGGYGSFPIFINIEGYIVGYYTDQSFDFHAFLRAPNGDFTTFSGPGACDGGTPAGCYGNEATIINSLGTAAGNFMDDSANFVGHGLIRSRDGELTTYDAPGAGTGFYQGTGCPGYYSGLNQSGTIAATYTDANNVHHGFLRSRDGEFTTFDAPGAGTGISQGTGCFSDCPVSLNDSGAITGVYIDGNYQYHGYLRAPEGRITTVDPTNSIGTLPFGINNRGEITGEYIDTNSVYHGFLTVPD